MRTTFFFLFAMLTSVAASAQSHITIEMISATYTTSPVVKFRISWSSIPVVLGEIHNSKIWVWIDFLKLNADNTTAGNTWTRAEVSVTPAVSSSPTSTAALDASTNKGFWLNGVTGSYSATITATLSNIPANTKFNWCAYASDCPPNVIANNGTYRLQGTAPFILKAANGDTQTVSGNTLTAPSLTIAAVTLTDKTECPGFFCPYTDADLHRDATHLCARRPTGAKNWEAWIKDVRDDELYRIVLMPDNKWWLAQNLKYAANGGVLFQSCGKDSCGRFYTTTEVFNGNYASNQQTICPAGWVLPDSTQWNTMAMSISNDLVVAFRDLRSLQLNCYPKTNNYGWATRGLSIAVDEPNDGDDWVSTNGVKVTYASIDNGAGDNLKCNDTGFWLSYGHYDAGFKTPVRCIHP
ncbi:MAG: hypothetical protein LBF81_00865 [Prevotellaceae bacterium]|jgi:uncharacterized protein (TIGR02145 family)|nr:hypothetical protein [Prevotellaceae bacterium]